MRKWGLGLIVALSLFNVLFPHSWIQGESKQSTHCEWCDEIGMKKAMQGMKEVSQLLTRKLLYREWDGVNQLSLKLKSIYDGLKMDNPHIPPDYLEFHEDYQKAIDRFISACKAKEGELADNELKRVKTACHYCHIRFVEEDQKDYGVALERLYKSK